MVDYLINKIIKLYNKYIIIITAENKEKTISNTILSCLNNLNSKNIKIIVLYSFLYNERILKKKFKLFTNVIFSKIFNKKKYPTQDQLFKIEQSLKYIKNEWVLLLDGDDLFKSKKIIKLNKLRLDTGKLYLHNHETQIGKFKFFSRNKFYKKNFLYKKLFNNWPENINTSSIVVNGKLLKKFYKNYNPYRWKYLAIDVQLVLFYFYIKKFKYLDYALTTKLDDFNNLDKTFSNSQKKIYWARRMEQHNLSYQLSGKLNLIDRTITYLFLNLL